VLYITNRPDFFRETSDFSGSELIKHSGSSPSVGVRRPQNGRK